MARFYGVVGYAESVESFPGSDVWKDVVTEFPYFGDVLRNTRQSTEAEKLNKDINVSNNISIVADAYAYENFLAIRYIQWAGSLWHVSDVEVQRPRLLLTLGGVYNGPTAGVVEDST